MQVAMVVVAFVCGTLVGFAIAAVFGYDQVSKAEEMADRWRRNADQSDRAVEELQAALARARREIRAAGRREELAAVVAYEPEEQPGPAPRPVDSYYVVIDDAGGVWVAHGPELDPDGVDVLETALVKLQTETNVDFPGGWEVDEAPMLAAMRRPQPGDARAYLIEQARQIMQDFVDQRGDDCLDALDLLMRKAYKKWLAGWAGAAMADATLDLTEQPVPLSNAASDRLIADLEANGWEQVSPPCPAMPVRPGAERYPFAAAAGLVAPGGEDELGDDAHAAYMETVAGDEDEA